MCAENAQVILRYLEESHRPSRNDQTKQTPNTQKQPNNTGPGLGNGQLFVSCRCETNLRRGETGGHRITQNGLSVLNVHVSLFKVRAACIRNVTEHYEASCCLCSSFLHFFLHEWRRHVCMAQRSSWTK